MNPHQGIERELRVVTLPGLGPELGWAVEGALLTIQASHRPGKHWAPKGWRLVAYAVTRPFTKAERERGAQIHRRRCWYQPDRWDGRLRPPFDAVTLDSIEAGHPSREARPRPASAPARLDANGQRPCRWCSTRFTPRLDPDQTYCSTTCRDLWNEHGSGRTR